METAIKERRQIQLEESAGELGLKYLNDSIKGFSRVLTGNGFIYLDTSGKKIENEKTLERINSLKIPPAWQHVWISPYVKGHLQVTGLDGKGRKQYLYHPEWSKMRCETKFDKMIAFGYALPIIRKQINKDLSKRHYTREKIVATVVALLDHTLIRIGNKVYEKENKSYGLTTLRDKHMKSAGKDILLEFKGKKGVMQSIKVTDRRLARIVKKCKEIPGQQLFQYYDENGERQALNSEDVNSYLKTVTGEEFSSKDFRTWGGSAYAVKLIQELDFPENEQELKKNINTVIKSVAEKLGNTITVCRKYYLHPIVIKAHTDDYIRKLIRQDPKVHLKGSKLLQTEEKIFLKILEKLN